MIFTFFGLFNQKKKKKKKREKWIEIEVEPDFFVSSVEGHSSASTVRQQRSSSAAEM